MPILTSLRKLACCNAPQEEDAEAPARRPLPQQVDARPEPAQAGPARAERPCREYVEDEARKYWQGMLQPGSLNKPGRQELRAGALPVLVLAQRNRPGWKLNPALNRAHMAINAVQLHLAESGRLKHPFTLSEAMPNYVESLIQLADDVGWLAPRVPLPDHPAPHHPAIYYTIDQASNRPIPRADALVRGDYVYVPGDGSRITQDEYIRPWRGPGVFPTANDLRSRGWDACYSLHGEGAWVRLVYHWFTGAPGEARITMRVDRFFSLAVRPIHFSPRPPSWQEIFRYRQHPARRFPGPP